ncbi:tryptophan 7-halogenase [Gilvimarinus agarilyticus]|uniref:tryptophan halogenase family protein n=1 Tax=Gilvimarinus sp. 2_MG-2023 TaxID=3062666 RepID=UPI001C0868A1|nr:tryptophan halogenase family protein [Gilvimarinus sp. 2_MG-2023]MBU2887499.1 tryptophan 7-halogenase [Gilvimarinus agarilyticus]MDO6572150.1 tryptophan 7-halogenase [Gilvimarinus sp. 2_MG-2023]
MSASKQESTGQPIKKIVILGGGTAGWMTAAALSKVFGAGFCEIELVESDSIGTVGVGEATIPQINLFNAVLGLDENKFIKDTKATFKLGIEFADWGKIGDSYIHPFAEYGTQIDNLPFYHYWKRLQLLGKGSDLGDYSLNVQAAYNNLFMRPTTLKNSPLSKIAYAFHFDAGLYAKTLREYAEQRNVKRTEGLVKDVKQDPDNGFITELHLKDGGVVSGDFFIDCSGFKGLLIEKVLKTGFDDWSSDLPCNSAVTVASERLDPLPSYTQSTAHEAGWRWRIPLQHRTGNGYVYCDKFIDDDKAADTLLQNINGKPLNEPRLLKFTTGKRKKFWVKNCLAIGLSSGFLEPLESTSIHFVQSAISKLLGLFPTKDFDPIVINKFNQQLEEDFLGVKDFLVLHYNATERNDSEFWRYCQNMPISDNLKEKIALYKSGCRVYRENNELFGDTSWVGVMEGQGISAYGYNPIVDALSEQELENKVNGIKRVIDKCLTAMGSHADYVEEICKSVKD